MLSCKILTLDVRLSEQKPGCQQCMPSVAAVSAVDAELERYEMSHGEQFGLAFWQDKHRQNAFTILASLALNLVAAPASEACVEHVLSVRSHM